MISIDWVGVICLEASVLVYVIDCEREAMSIANEDGFRAIWKENLLRLLKSTSAATITDLIRTCGSEAFKTAIKVVGRGKTQIFGPQPRGTYSSAEIDDMLAERDQMAKAQKREIDLLRRVVESDSRMS
ncbi:hypothetical protein Tco_1310314 [Tanacetum coccineum]